MLAIAHAELFTYDSVCLVCKSSRARALGGDHSLLLLLEQRQRHVVVVSRLDELRSVLQVAVHPHDKAAVADVDPDALQPTGPERLDAIACVYKTMFTRLAFCACSLLPEQLSRAVFNTFKHRGHHRSLPRLAAISSSLSVCRSPV